MGDAVDVAVRFDSFNESGGIVLPSPFRGNGVMEPEEKDVAVRDQAFLNIGPRCLSIEIEFCSLEKLYPFYRVYEPVEEGAWHPATQQISVICYCQTL